MPWIPQSMIISEESLDMTEIPMSSLPDADKKQVLMGNSAVASQETNLDLDSTQALRTEYPKFSAPPDLAAPMFYNDMKWK